MGRASSCWFQCESRRKPPKGSIFHFYFHHSNQLDPKESEKEKSMSSFHARFQFIFSSNRLRLVFVGNKYNEIKMGLRWYIAFNASSTHPSSLATWILLVVTRTAVGEASQGVFIVMCFIVCIVSASSSAILYASHWIGCCSWKLEGLNKFQYISNECLFCTAAGGCFTGFFVVQQC